MIICGKEPDMKANLKEISRITGYSPATVSNALNGKKNVSRDTAKMILEVAKKIGYTDSVKISNIRFVIYKKTGKIVGDSPFFSSLITGVEDEARQAGYNTILTNINESDEDIERRMNELLSDSSSALLVLATELDEKRAENFERTSVPVVMLDNYFEYMNFNSVLINNSDSVMKAVDYLIDKGHRDIGYIKGSTDIKNFTYRYEGYRRSMEKHGLLTDEDKTISLSTDMEGAYNDMLKFLSGCDKLPTAYFADNDMIALGAMKALKEKGFRVPEDVSLIGFDDLPFSSISDPPLTTIRVPKEQMGSAAMRRLIEMINIGDDLVTKTQVCNEFIERGSVKNISDN